MSARYLLDTNLLSESRRKQPNAGVTAFLTQTDPTLLRISVLTLGELRKGVAIKGRSDQKAAQQIESWIDGLELSFAGQILAIDISTARLWGEWSARRPRAVVDTLLAATACVNDLVLVTRNTTDVSDLPIQILNPWDEPGQSKH